MPFDPKNGKARSPPVSSPGANCEAHTRLAVPIIPHFFTRVLPKLIRWTPVRPARAVRPPVEPLVRVRERESLMDLATLLGYLLAWGVLLYGMFHATQGQLGAYVNPGELLLVMGCAFGAAMASMPLHSVLSAFKCTKKMLFSKEMHIEHLIKEMVQYAETARRDGVLALESVARDAPDP